MFDAAIQPPPTDRDKLLAEIAARYGATVAPGAHVTTLPTGLSSRPYPVWDPNGKRLVYPDNEGGKRIGWRSGASGGGNPHLVKAAEARRPHVARLHGEGQTAPQIAAALSCTESQVRGDLAALGLVPHDARQVAQVTLLARLRELISAGHTDRDIAPLLGRSVQTLRRIARDEGLALRFAVPEKKPRALALAKPVKTAEEKAARKRANAKAWYARKRGRAIDAPTLMDKARQRRAAVADAHARGLTARETLDALPADLKADLPRVYADLRHLGLNPNPTERADRDLRLREKMVAARAAVQAPKRRHAALREQVAQRHMAGETVEAIASAEAVPARRVAAVLRAEGHVPTFAAARDAAAKLADLVARVGRGETAPQIAAAWGTTAQGVYEYAHRKGVSLVGRLRGASWNAKVVSPKVAARRDRVRALRAAGATLDAMQAELGVCRATLCQDILALGLVGTSPNTPARRSLAAHRPDLARKALDLQQQGLGLLDIARDMHLPHYTVRRLLQAATKFPPEAA